ncbi:lantibiotic dehydratase, partial [Xanthovirga aplysinae]|uniref:lantibiotic dehydratase n=1 Tax=Xanthovirga aplysinae TaxID=2529853 RepID=UPI0031B62498
MYKVSRIDYNKYLEEVLNRSIKGTSFEDLVNLLLNHGFNLTDSTNYINSLIQYKVLVSDFNLSVLGDNTISYFINKLKSWEKDEPQHQFFLEKFNKIKAFLDEIDSGVGVELHSYKQLESEVNEILETKDLSRLFNTSVSSVLFNGKINRNIQNDIKKVIKLLYNVTEKDSKTSITEFAENFTQKYGDAAVPLVLALDDKYGIGFQNSDNLSNEEELINDVSYPNSSEEKFTLGKWENFLLEKYLECLKEKKSTIELTDHVVQDFLKTDNYDFLPETFSIRLRHLGKKNENDMVQVYDLSGPTGSKILTRFSNNDHETRKIIRDLTQFENNQLPKEYILAEITH